MLYRSRRRVVRNSNPMTELLEPRRLLSASPGDALVPQHHEVPVISVTRHAKHASENGPTPRPFTIWRSGNLDSPVVVFFTIGGTATNGVDYGFIGNAITIPAGEDHFRIWVRPVDDDIPEPTETVTLTLNPNPNYVIGEPVAATIRIIDNDTNPLPPPVVMVTAPERPASENGPTARPFTIWRSGSLDSNLVVSFTIGGTATNGVDYGFIGTAITIPAGEDHFRIWVRPVDDDIPEPTETVTLTLNPNPRYVIGDSPAATIRIIDNDTVAPAPNVVNVTAPGSPASEDGVARPFTISRSGDLTHPLVVSFTVGGTATNGVDYGIIGNAITIPAGESTFRIWVRPIDDDLVEGTETVTLTLSVSSAYTIGDSPTATIEILDNDFHFGTTLSWSTRASSPIPRGEAQAAVIDNKLFVFGGYFDGTATPSARSDVYNPATNTWTRIADMPEPATHAGTAVIGGNVYIAGGYIGPGGGGSQTFASRQVQVYNVDSNTWSSLPLLPEARGGGALAAVGNSLHFFGGSNLARQDRPEHWALDLNNTDAGWVSKAPLPTLRNHLGAVTLAGKIYAVGGQQGQDEAQVPQSALEVYDPATNAWQLLAPLPFGRSHTASSTLVVQGRIVVLGGETTFQNRISNVTAYDPATNSWTSLTPLPVARASGVAAFIDGAYYFTTGDVTSTTYRGEVIS